MGKNLRRSGHLAEGQRGSRERERWRHKSSGKKCKYVLLIFNFVFNCASWIITSENCAVAPVCHRIFFGMLLLCYLLLHLHVLQQMMHSEVHSLTRSTENCVRDLLISLDSRLCQSQTDSHVCLTPPSATSRSTTQVHSLWNWIRGSRTELFFALAVVAYAFPLHSMDTWNVVRCQPAEIILRLCQFHALMSKAFHCTTSVR